MHFEKEGATMSTVIKLEGVSKSYDSQLLYASVYLKILSGEKVLLCGDNGCGKTTLTRLMTGELEPDKGTVTIAPEIKISKFEQFENLTNNVTVSEYIENVFISITSIEKQIRKLETTFAKGYSEAISKEYAQLVDSFESAGGYNYLRRKDEFLREFGLLDTLDRYVLTLSSGEQQYLRLASTIFSEASLLILDEPFTFLDNRKVKWLLNYLKDIKKTVVVISHDFCLAGEFATSVISIKNWQIKKYKCGFDSFLEESSLENMRHTQLNATLDNYISERKESIAKQKEWMKKAKNKHQHAVLIRRLERDVARAQKNKYEYKKNNRFDISTMVVNEYKQYNELLIKLENIKMLFDGACILDDVSISIYSNTHYLILGENGAGKTTLLNIMMKNISPSQGEVRYSRKIVFASLTQLSNDIKKHHTCLEAIGQICNKTKEDCISKYSEYFDVDFWDKRISVLSCGELRKFYVFLCLLREFDVLVLDEPTTFVDAHIKSSIIKMINSCSKCVLVVTHDMELIDNMHGNKLYINNGAVINIS